MPSIRALVMWVCFLSMFSGSAVVAQTLPSSAIDAGKAATALVVIDGQGVGSAFCIDEKGRFITNYHVIDRVSTGGEVSLVLRAGEDGQQVILAKLVHSDHLADLAVLQASDKFDAKPLPLGDVGGLVETMDVGVFGYPFGRMLQLERDGYPNISINLGRISSLRKRDGELGYIQFDAEVQPGNSGGPLVNAKGQVIGVVVAKVHASSVNFAVPVNRLRQFLGAVSVRLELPDVKFEDREKTARFLFRAYAAEKVPDDLRIVLTLGEGDEARTVVARPAGEDKYVATAQPVQPARQSTSLQVIVTTEEGDVEALLPRRKIRVGETLVELGGLQSLHPGDSPPYAITGDGQRIEGEIKGLTSVLVETDGRKKSIALRDIKQIHMAGSSAAQGSRDVAYSVALYEGENLIETKKGKLYFTQSPETSGQSDTVKTEQLDTPAGWRSIALPGTIKEVEVGGGGDWLALWLQDVRKVCIFDVKNKRITGYIDTTSDRVIIAAGKSKLFVLQTDSWILERYDLATRQRELRVFAPAINQPFAMTMGALNDDTLCIAMRRALKFYDAHTLRERTFSNVDEKTPPPIGDGTDHELYASADGSTYYLTGHGEPVVINVRGDKLDVTRLSMDMRMRGGVLYPNMDGSAFGGNGHVYNGEIKVLRAIGDGKAIPAVTGRYFMLTAAPEGITNHSAMEMRVAVATQSNLIDLEMFGADQFTHLFKRRLSDARGRQRAEGAYQRLHLFADQGVLVGLPRTDAHLTWRTFDLDRALKSSSEDYLFVASPLERTARVGERYHTQIDVKSKAGGVTFELNAGPEGMKIDDKGMITWTPSADTAPTSMGIVITIRDASKQSLLHTYVLRVE